MKQPKTIEEFDKAISKLEKANEKWFDTEREKQIKDFKLKRQKLKTQ